MTIDFIDQKKVKGTGDHPEFFIDSIEIFRFQPMATMSIHIHRENACLISLSSQYGEKETKQKIEAI